MPVMFYHSVIHGLGFFICQLKQQFASIITKTFLAHIFVQFHINCYYNFNPCGIFEKMMSFSPVLSQDLEQGKLMSAVNSRK